MAYLAAHLLNWLHNKQPNRSQGHTESFRDPLGASSYRKDTPHNRRNEVSSERITFCNNKHFANLVTASACESGQPQRGAQHLAARMYAQSCENISHRIDWVGFCGKPCLLRRTTGDPVFFQLVAGLFTAVLDGEHTPDDEAMLLNTNCKAG